ncbi:MAG: RNA-binding domain-containing protein [Thermoplasmatota archaeon]
MSLDELKVEVDIWTPLNPTETEKKVLFCLKQIFPDAEWEVKNGKIIGTTNSLERFKKILKDMKIRDTARSYMLNKTFGNRCSFTLSKQASCNKRINFSDVEKPLGGIKVNIISDHIEKIINELTKKDR